MPPDRPTCGWIWTFIRLTSANILANLMVPLAGLIDTAFLGHLAEIQALAGVALANIIFNVIFWSFGFLRMATTGLTAQAVGRGDADGVQLVGWRSVLLGLGLGLLIVILQVPLRQIGFALLQADAAVRLAGQAFYDARIWGAPAVLMNYALLGWFLGRGQGRVVLLMSLVSNGSNIGLDYWFIRQLGWASFGAGLATTLSQYLMLLTGLGWLLRGLPWARLGSLRRQLGQTAALRQLLALNGDILVRSLALVLSFSLFTNFSSVLGTSILAMNTILIQVVLLAAYFIDGVAYATESFAGQFAGQGAVERLRALLWLAGGLSAGFGIAFAAAFIGWPHSLFGLLTNHQPLLEQLPRYTGWLLPVLGFGALAFMLDGYFLGLTAGHTLRNAMLLAVGVGFLPVAIAAYQRRSPHLLWCALSSFMAMRALTLAWVVPQTLGSQRISTKKPSGS